MHIAKDYDDRKEEFLNTAQALFNKNGYEETTINAIINTIGVSKGAFYYYFKSKEDLLDALAERQAVAVSNALATIVQDNTIDALTKLNKVFAMSTGYKAQNRELIITLLEVMYDDRNLRLRKRLEKRSLAASIPPIAEILRQGGEQGVFMVDDAEESAILVMQLGSALSERLSENILSAAKMSAEKHEARRLIAHSILKAMTGYAKAIERILGIAPGGIQFVTEDLVTIILGRQEENL